MTTNLNWPEITDNLEPGQTAYDRLDLVACVFQLKHKALMDKVCKGGVFGAVAAHVYTIEFQKRGLPHAHMAFWLKNPYKLTTVEAIDSCISAWWPDPVMEPVLFEVVKTCMIHRPCGAANPKAPCMVDKKCLKGFPKAFQEVTTMDGNGYPLYC